jgi:L-fuculose-phosphate aldolase
LYERGMIAGTDGNISIRIDKSRVLITPSGRSKGTLKAEDIVIIDLDGNLLEGRHSKSSEFDMHLEVYRIRPDITACVHAHPPFATAFAVAGEKLVSEILPEALLFIGEIALTEFAPPGTARVGQSLAPFLATHQAFLLKNHGVLTIGSTLSQAHNRMETVEHLARISYLARRLGAIDVLPEEEIRRLNDMRRALDKNSDD